METRFRLVDCMWNIYPVGDEGLSLGRSAANDIVIDDPAVAERHARVMVAGGHCWVMDRDSPTGTLVNGAAVKGVAKICPGDILSIGGAQYRLAAEASPATPRMADTAPTEVVGPSVATDTGASTVQAVAPAVEPTAAPGMDRMEAYKPDTRLQEKTAPGSGEAAVESGKPVDPAGVQGDAAAEPVIPPGSPGGSAATAARPQPDPVASRSAASAAHVTASTQKGKRRRGSWFWDLVLAGFIAGAGFLLLAGGVFALGGYTIEDVSFHLNRFARQYVIGRWSPVTQAAVAGQPLGISLPDAEAWVKISADGIAPGETVSLKIAQDAEAVTRLLDDERLVAGPLYEIESRGVQPGMTATIALAVETGRLSPAELATVQLAYVHEGQFITIPSSVDPNTHRVTGVVTHFSAFTWIARALGNEPPQVTILTSPTQYTGVTFSDQYNEQAKPFEEPLDIKVRVQDPEDRLGRVSLGITCDSPSSNLTRFTAELQSQFVELVEIELLAGDVSGWIDEGVFVGLRDAASDVALSTRARELLSVFKPAKHSVWCLDPKENPLPPANEAGEYHLRINLQNLAPQEALDSFTIYVFAFDDLEKSPREASSRVLVSLVDLPEVRLVGPDSGLYCPARPILSWQEDFAKSLGVFLSPGIRDWSTMKLVFDQHDETYNSLFDNKEWTPLSDLEDGQVYSWGVAASKIYHDRSFTDRRAVSYTPVHTFTVDSSLKGSTCEFRPARKGTVKIYNQINNTICAVNAAAPDEDYFHEDNLLGSLKIEPGGMQTIYLPLDQTDLILSSCTGQIIKMVEGLDLVPGSVETVRITSTDRVDYLKVVNQGKEPVCEVYLREVGDFDWGSNQVEGSTIEPGYSTNFLWEKGSFDVLIRDCHGRQVFAGLGLAVSRETVVTVTEVSSSPPTVPTAEATRLPDPGSTGSKRFTLPGCLAIDLPQGMSGTSGEAVGENPGSFFLYDSQDHPTRVALGMCAPPEDLGITDLDTALDQALAELPNEGASAGEVETLTVDDQPAIRVQVSGMPISEFGLQDASKGVLVIIQARDDLYIMLVFTGEASVWPAYERQIREMVDSIELLH